MKVHHVMSREIFTATPDILLPQVWEILSQKHINALPVVDRKKKLLGIVTKEDLLKTLFPEMGEFFADFMGEADFEEMEKKLQEKKQLKAQQVMNTKVIFTRSDTPIMRALARMIARSVNQLPVLSEADEVIGLVTKGDIFYALVRSPSVPVATEAPLATKKKRK